MDNTPEHVAYLLMLAIGKAENKRDSFGNLSADRQWLLDTYAECLTATLNRRFVKSGNGSTTFASIL